MNGPVPSMVALRSAVVCLAVLAATPAQAQTCTPPDQGLFCINSGDCAGNTLATVCAGNLCAIPCATDTGAAAPNLCSLGETCVYAESDRGPTYICKSSSFVMDLNLLDSCIAHFVDGLRPDLSPTLTCSLEQTLGRMLDQNSDRLFNIFDVDLCIKSFLGAERCDALTQSCPDGQVYCAADSGCGQGLHCNPELLRCERECGLITTRSENAIEALDRQCARPLTVCNYDRGRCERISLTGTTCQVDADCPAGAACFMGECSPKCFRSADCPDAGWFCAADNRCLPRPSPQADSGFVFDPTAYSVRFARKDLALSAIESETSIPLLIMNVRTKKQEFNNPSVVFGYRLEVTYSRKQDPKCMKPAAEWSEAERADCLIDPSEEYVTIDRPFGVVYATGNPSFALRLNRGAAERLSPGLYQATVTTYLSNGGQDSASISFKKTSPSGEYLGRLSIYVDGPNNLLGSANLSMQVFVNTAAPMVQWTTLMQEQGLAVEEEFIDVTEGYRVSGFIHGNDSMVFNLPAARTNAENEIPVRGIYSPARGRMRIIGTIDIAPDFCRSDRGDCATTPTPTELRVENIFGRKIRRLFQFIGPFDTTLQRFHGMYRETISGLTPESMTFDGGFQIDQWRSDETSVAATPLYATPAAPVTFPGSSSLVASLTAPGGDIPVYCEAVGLGAAPTAFASKESYKAYIEGACPDADRNGRCDCPAALNPDGTCSVPIPRSVVFPQLVRFEGEVQNALDSMTAPAGALTIQDFLRGQVGLCSDPSIDPDATCVDDRQLRCGLALQRKAVLSGWQWVNLNDLGPGNLNGFAQHQLFCSKLMSTPGCELSGLMFPTVVGLQEHNRFFKELTQALRYSAGNDLSDAFFAMYRAGNGSIARAEALSYKQSKLFSSWRRYDSLRRELFSSPSSAVLFAWPMRGFEAFGRPWLAEMHAAMNDRLDALTEIIDLKRRLLATATEQDFGFVHHFMHMEYLAQAYLVALQLQWEQENFAYAGQGPAALEAGEMLLARVNDTRNPLGIYPRQVFFENSNLGVSNWKNYRRQILEGPPSSGLLGEVKLAVQEAIANLKGSLADKATFETQILGARHQFQQEIDSLCGSPVPFDPTRGSCEVPTAEERALQAKCQGPACLYEYRCEGQACDSVMRAFSSATGAGLAGSSCDLSTDSFPLQVGTNSRQCTRGQMGTLLQEREQLRLQRKQTVRKVSALLRQIASQTKLLLETKEDNAELRSYLGKHRTAMAVLEQTVLAAEFAYDAALAAAQGLDCFIVVGMANGTNCAGSFTKSTAAYGAVAIKYGVIGQIEVGKGVLERTKELRLLTSSQDAEVRRQKAIIDNLTTEVDNLISEYEMVTQTLFNLNVRIDDTYFLARRASERNNEQFGNLVDHLIGGESGSVLMRNQFVQQANARFHELLVATYKMAVAFIHNYNLQAQAAQITNRVFQIMTPEDVADFIRELDLYEINYCGGAGIDCDSVNNTHHFRYSLREQLFPSLRDIVDSRTGQVLTRGEQFHNLVTSSRYLRTRERAGRLVQQIELPFFIWLNDRGDANGAVQQWMVSPLECNHIMVGNGNGTVAANVVGTRMRNLTYELWRGNTDYLRACEPVQTVDNGAVRTDYPINPFIVGYAPQNSLAQEAVPPSYLSHSSGLAACKNVPELGGHYITQEACFHYFARDRSLAAPDWKLVIPFEVGFGNEWIYGPDDPIIEDIILYFRYRTRPI